jgi:pyruvate dehydrogenase E1 component beta subunit
MMRHAIASDDPVMYIDSGLAYDQVEDVAVGGDLRPARARVVRPGTNVTLVAVSGTVARALKVVERLAGEGISVEVVDPQVLSPLDRKGILESVARTGHLVVVDEAQLSCGMGSEIVSSVVEHGYDLLKAAPRRVAIPDVPVPPNPTQFEAIMPTESRIEAAVRAALD